MFSVFLVALLVLPVFHVDAAHSAFSRHRRRAGPARQLQKRCRTRPTDAPTSTVDPAPSAPASSGDLAPVFSTMLSPDSSSTPLAVASPGPDSSPVSVPATATPTASDTTPTSTPASNQAKVATSWYAGWHASDYPISDITWSKYTQMTYSFATTTSDGTFISLADSDAQLLTQFVTAAHQNGVKASLSIGGWGGSQFYSTNVGSAENRTGFVAAITAVVQKYQLDGIDFDWEYPNHQGIGCNIINTADTSNFLSLLQELRADPVGQNLILSAATSITPWVGPDNTPLSDVSPFGKVLNYVAIMNYDIWGSWSSSVGPNSPLDDSCAPAADQQGSAVSAVKAWSAAGMPLNQIVLGVASYGHSFSVSSAAAMTDSTTLASYPAFNKASQPAGDKWGAGSGVDSCGVQEGPAGTYSFAGLIEDGFLDNTGAAVSGISYRFDQCSGSAYVYNPSTQVMVSFDDAPSFQAKGQFINTSGLGGFAMWEAGGDSNNILIDAIRGSAGFS